MERNEATKVIRKLLKEITGRAWSVRGGQGTGWGWIKVKSRKPYTDNEFGDLTAEEGKTLQDAFDLYRPPGNVLMIAPGGRDDWIKRLKERAAKVR